MSPEYIKQLHNQALELLNLQPNWDGEGAEPPMPQTVDDAIKIINDLASYNFDIEVDADVLGGVALYLYESRIDNISGNYAWITIMNNGSRSIIINKYCNASQKYQPTGHVFSELSLQLMKSTLLNQVTLRDRIAEKQLSREADQRALDSGEKTAQQIQEENSFIPTQCLGQIDFSKVPIAQNTHNRHMKYVTAYSKEDNSCALVCTKNDYPRFNSPNYNWYFGLNQTSSARDRRNDRREKELGPKREIIHTDVENNVETLSCGHSLFDPPPKTIDTKMLPPKIRRCKQCLPTK